VKAFSSKYGKSALCKALKINRSTVYYKTRLSKEEKEKSHREDMNTILEIFNANRKEYGSKKIKKELKKKDVVFSRRKIIRLMKEAGIKSSYGKRSFKPCASKGCNESKVSNLIGREFNCWNRNEVIVSDLTYVRVNGEWNYICVLIDLFNREIVGWSVGRNKTSSLVMSAFSNANIDFNRVMIFHTDRGLEFCNKHIDDFILRYGIIRSLSHKGTPYDNAVAESTYKIIKTEFVKQESFKSLEMLRLCFGDYVHWFNCCRIHSSLNYMAPVEYRNAALKKIA
jgi:transposase InsO family protein